MGHVAASPAQDRHHGALRRILHNSALNLLGFGVCGVCTLVVVFILARGLGKEGLGRYYTVYALLVLVQLVTEAGIATILTRRIARAPAAWKETVAEASGLLVLAIVVAAGCLLGIGLAWSHWRNDPEALVLFAWAALACAGMHTQRFCAAVFQAFDRFGYESFGRVLQAALFTTGIVLLVPSRGGLTLALALLAASHVAEALFLAVALESRQPCLGWRCSPAVVRAWLVEAVPLGLADLLRRITWQVDTLLLALLAPAAVVGIYSVAYRPLGPLNWVPQAILLAAFPAFARLALTDRPALNRAFTASVRLLWIISLPMAVAIGVCAEAVVAVLAGPEFGEAVPLLRLLIGITSLSFLSYPFRFLFTAVDRRRVYLALVLLVLTLEASIEALLIPHWGALGACTGSIVGETVFTVIGLVLCREMGIGAIDARAMVRAAVAAAVMGVALWPLRGIALPLLPLAVLGTSLLYLALCVWLGALERDEIKRVHDTFVRPLLGRSTRPVEGKV
jgi:O-antigen/teichoic acid export membrane protein